MKTLNHTQQTIREKQIQEYLISQYGEDYFTLDDLLNMCICDNGDVYIGFIQFKTPFKLEDY